MQPLYTRCLRCKKHLKDHKSKSRGYGPTCWKKKCCPLCLLPSYNRNPEY
ncbi:DUF6011 domain-containing protein [Methanosarcina horonobensis]